MKICITSVSEADASYEFIEQSEFNIPTVLQALYNMLVELGHEVDYSRSTTFLRKYDLILVGCCFIKHSYSNTNEHLTKVAKFINRNTDKVMVVYNSWQVLEAVNDFKLIAETLPDTNPIRIMGNYIYSNQVPALVPTWNDPNIEKIKNTFPHDIIYWYNPATHVPSSQYGINMMSERTKTACYADMSFTTKEKLGIFKHDVEIVNFRTKPILMHEKDLVEQVYVKHWFILMPSHDETSEMGFWRSKVQHAINVNSVLVSDEFESAILGDSFNQSLDELMNFNYEQLNEIAAQQKLQLQPQLDNTANLEHLATVLSELP